MPSELFDPLFTSESVAAELDDRAWVQAMLDVEAALAEALAEAGLVRAEHAHVVVEHCRADLFDIASIGRRAASSGSPAIPLVRDLTALVPEDAARSVHFGATSQDVVDTAGVLVRRRALGPILDDARSVADACARLAGDYREAVLPGRSFGQHGPPTTFGCVAAGWMHGVDTALQQLTTMDHPLQFGGAVGTLAPLGDAGIEVRTALARRLELADPAVPWHTLRGDSVAFGGALARVLGALGKIARDVVTLGRTEIAEVAEPSAPGRGTSSTMPHKRNPVGSVLTSAAAHRAPGLVSSLYAGMLAEDARPAGPWHAEWETLRELLRLTGGAAAAMREVCGGLNVHPDRMRSDVDSTHGLVMAESVVAALTPHFGRLPAHDRVEHACAEAVEQGRHLREVLLDDTDVTGALGTDGVDAALDPASFLGSAGAFVDRALAEHRSCTS
ncbi:3-carboxy-cis,cis-muconate cycloisomerase [Allosaccharopolyspora coralli]|uniref:3-carboxy-cis,cis-muconate cycloisomerase n=1 Tax=Allosaccharopolyspora coralli TaxID=2665642 RepID=UPI001E282876|nr:3-carboxy-cis,cis-muconate cycloisomerase [Allosaccharopolyspora coralli]